MQDFANGQPSNGQAEAPAAEQAQPSITSLDSLSEFEFQGEKFTPDRFQEVYKGYKSYGEQVKQSQAEDRYWSNLDTDIESVLADPTLADKFKSIYPQKFHRVLERVLGSSNKPAQQSQALPKEYLAKLSKIDQLEQNFQQMSVDAANAKLDAILPKLYDKYPLANEDQVLSRAEAMISQGMKLTEGVWERIAKESHEFVSKKADAYYKKQLQTQTEKGQLGKDAPAGGQPAGRAPQKFTSFEEAGKAAMAHIKSQGL